MNFRCYELGFATIIDNILVCKSFNISYMDINSTTFALSHHYIGKLLYGPLDVHFYCGTYFSRGVIKLTSDDRDVFYYLEDKILYRIEEYVDVGEDRSLAARLKLEYI